MKIGFIGIGNMGGAMIKGFIQSGRVEAENIFVSNRTPERMQDFVKETNVQACRSNKEVVEKAEIVFLAVKPKDFPEILSELQPAFQPGKSILVSIAAGMTLEQLEQYTNEAADMSIIRVMPNLGSLIGEGMTAVAGNEAASQDDVSLVLNLLALIGEAIELPEEQFSIFSAIAGCSPAFTFTYIDALARAAVRHGLNKETATRIASQAVLGSAKTVLESGISPMNLADQVASPGGTTIEGVLTLADTGFVSAVVQAVDASYKKDIEMIQRSSENPR